MREKCLLFFGLVPLSLFALPQGESLKSGTASFLKNKDLLSVEVSDKAIIDYESFNIEAFERVEFIQPKSSSTLLNRVQGNDSSKILGNIVSNGKVFLVNPNGVYFGENAAVDARSFIVSTLDILNNDFLQENYCFSLKPGTETAVIHNLGSLSALPGGAVVLIAPQVINEGTIIADIGQVVLASAEKVTIDFMGDGMLQFAVEGLAAESGLAGKVMLNSETAQKILQDVVNIDGLIFGSELIEKEGVIHLRAKSHIEAEDIKIIGANVQIEGELQSSWDIHVESKNIVCVRDFPDQPILLYARRHFTLESSFIDIVAWENPYTFIGSSGNLTFISDNPISADGRFFAGGDFSLLTHSGVPADFVCKFDPIITSTGSVTFGAYSGASLKVESAGNITCTGNITITMADAMACTPSGCGSDPDCAALAANPILILSAGTAPASPSCNSVTSMALMFSGTTFSNPGGSGSSINFTDTSTTTLSGFTSATFTGDINASGNLTITSSGGATDLVQVNGVIFVGPGKLKVTCGALSVSGAVTTIPGALDITTVGDITLSGVTSSNSKCDLNSTGGGTITVGNVTAVAPGSPMTIQTTGPIILDTPGSSVSLIGFVSSPVTISGASLNVSNNQDIILQANNNTLTVNCPIGTMNPPNSVSITGGTTNAIVESITTGSGGISIGNSCTAQGTFQTSNGPVTLDALTLSGNLTITTGGGAIDLSTVDGAATLTLTAGTGIVTLNGNIGSGTALNNFGVTSSGGINLGADITTSVNTPFSLTGPIMLIGDSVLTIAGAPTFTSTIDGDFDFTLNSAHTVSFQSDIGSIVPLNSFAVLSYSTLDLSAVSVNANTINIQPSAGIGVLTTGLIIAGSGGAALQGYSALTLTDDITANNAAININTTAASTIDLQGSITIDAGTDPMLSVIFIGKPMTAMTMGDSLTLEAAARIDLYGDLTTNNGAITINGPVLLHTPVNLSSSGGNITLSNVDNLQVFVVDAGTGVINLQGSLGSVTPLSSFTANASLLNLGNNITTQSGVITFNENVILTNNATLSTSGGTITFTGTIDGQTAGTESLTLLSGAGTINFGGNVGSAASLNTFSAAGSAFNFMSNTTLTASNSITFSGGSINLLGGTSFILNVSGGNIAFDSIVGSGQNVGIFAGGIATLGAIQTINEVVAIAGQILLDGIFNVNQVIFLSQTSIENVGVPQIINLTTNSIFETQSGTIGTLASPIAINNPSGIVIAGTPSQLADFTGVTLDNTIHRDPNNLPCPVIFNAITLFSCPPQPPPPPPPSPVISIPARSFYVPGIYSQYNSLASNVYFLPEIVYDSYVEERHQSLFFTNKRYVKPKPPYRHIKGPLLKRQYRSM